MSRAIYRVSGSFRMSLSNVAQLQKPRGLTKDEISKNTIEFKFGTGRNWNTKDIEWDNCAICIDEFKQSEDVRLLYSCRHVFHVKCVDQWLTDNTTCPICRQDVKQVEEPNPSVDMHEEQSLQQSTTSSEISAENTNLQVNPSFSPSTEVE